MQLKGDVRMKNRIAELRKERGLTLKQLGASLEIRDNTLSQYETGKRQPRDQETWQKLADYFGVSVAYLMGVSDYTIDEKQIKKLADEAIEYILKSDSDELLKKSAIHFKEKNDYSKLVYEYYSKYNDTLAKLGIDVFSFWFENYILEIYQEDVKNNENFIRFIKNLFPDDINSYKYYKENTVYIGDTLDNIAKQENIETDTDLKGITVFSYEYEKSVNQKLIDEVSELFRKLYKDLDELIEKYPDEEPEKVKFITLISNQGLYTTIEEGKTIENELNLPEDFNKTFFDEIINYLDEKEETTHKLGR